MTGIDKLLELLSNNTGLSVNRYKTKVFFKQTVANKEELKLVLGMTERRLPIKYLYILLSANYLKG